MIALSFFLTLNLAIDGVLIYLGATSLGILLTLTTLMSALVVCFWYYRFGDSRFYPRKNITPILLLLFLGGMVQVLSAKNFDFSATVMETSKQSGRDLVEGLKAVSFLMGPLLLTSFVILFASREKEL